LKIAASARISIIVVAQASMPIITERIMVFPLGSNQRVEPAHPDQAIGSTGMAALIISDAKKTEAATDTAMRWKESKRTDMVFLLITRSARPSGDRYPGQCK